MKSTTSGSSMDHMWDSIFLYSISDFSLEMESEDEKPKLHSPPAEGPREAPSLLLIVASMVAFPVQPQVNPDSVV
jgi:hypothetical protein